ncbi:cilia- and flagella-associated protein 157-like [Schistocerca gregaria]|uniref:cilia- and flagella-associated protein 157-like n=1 Tax=Schistocerca gregaria TaxID=7010 RepID=UPI00211EC00E|nr:cilia- and flagella-associated protein 157-like [Schistocerca gregaria]
MGKKGKGKKGPKEPLPLLAEVEREMFQLHINDITRKLERITAQCLELEKSNEEYEKKYKKLDEDRGDIITYLKRTLQEKSDEAKQLQETVDQLTLEKTTMQENFSAKIAQMEHEFKVMQEQLTGDIKLLTGRLKALEHFRVHQDELMNKFKQQEIEIEEREKEHKRMLYEVEKKFIIAKDKAMKDMEVRQLQLSSEFEATTQMCIAASTKRAIRENIAVNNELRKVQETTYRLIKENEKLKEHDRHMKIQKELTEEEKTIVMQENAEHLKASVQFQDKNKYKNNEGAHLGVQPVNMIILTSPART